MRIDQHGVNTPSHQQQAQAANEQQQVQAGNGPQQAPVVHAQAHFAALLVNLGNYPVPPANLHVAQPVLAAQGVRGNGLAMLLSAAAYLQLDQHERP